jgi:hypothetical protein
MSTGKLSEFKQKHMVKVRTRIVCEDIAKAYLVANKMAKRRRAISYGKQRSSYTSAVSPQDVEQNWCDMYHNFS